MSCDMLNKYLEHRLTPENAAQFESHLPTCISCRQAVDNWKQINAAMTAVLNKKMPPPHQDAANRLMARAGSSGKTEATERRIPSRAWRWGAVATVAATVLVTAVFIGSLRGKSSSSRVGIKAQVLYPQDEELMAEGDALFLLASSAAGMVVKTGNARIGLTKGSRARILQSNAREINLALADGTLGVSFAPRKHRGKLTILVGAYTVRVVGTQFWVSRVGSGELEVGVVTGRVVVDDDSRHNSHHVVAGNRLLIQKNGKSKNETITPEERHQLSIILNPGGAGANRMDPAQMRNPLSELTSEQSVTGDNDSQPPADAAPGKVTLETKRSRRKIAGNSVDEFDLDSVKQWVLNGEHKKASAALNQHLLRNPADVDAMLLLSNCYGRMGRYADAVATLQSVVQKAPPSRGNQARFKAATIYADRLNAHNEAIRLYEAYLRAPASQRANTPEARIRLARSLNIVGDQSRRRKVLQTIVAAHPGTEAAAEARSQLEQLEGKGGER